ncbi:hypothetical protein OQA88_11462 [Cercophora sp. LCS_1]
MAVPETRQSVLNERQREFEREARDLERSNLGNLEKKSSRVLGYDDALEPTERAVPFSAEKPYKFDPYPYNRDAWQSQHADYVPCEGPSGVIEDIHVFKGHPKGFPVPGFGGYDILGLSENLCFERETRMGHYGLGPAKDRRGENVNRDKANWGELQKQCRERNSERYKLAGPTNKYLRLLDDDDKHGLEEEIAGAVDLRAKASTRVQRRDPNGRLQPDEAELAKNTTTKVKEPGTALILRSFTGKEYSENDKQLIRSLITELGLRTGREYEVFLFLHDKENNAAIWSSEEVYRATVEKQVPPEFWNITVLWNEDKVQRTYPKLTPKARLAHNGQFSPVQIFMQEYRKFDCVWNWEMDSRVIGHHYDLLTKLSTLARGQPRKFLWERNERYYIPSVHGDHTTAYRKNIFRTHADSSTKGAPPSPITPIDPKPPVRTPDEDGYVWGVGEEADIITLAPVFNPVNSNWILRNQVWGYRSRDFAWGDLPRRATVTTQLRAPRKLMDIMHVEDLRGNHVASEMAAQTVALLHGLKAVYTPIPVFFDRPWEGKQLAKWFNGGPRGESGSFGSAMGWGMEGRFQGSTWYYRAGPPQRLYNNWMGAEDSGIGGEAWEKENGRVCLPTVLLHPIKEVRQGKKA